MRCSNTQYCAMERGHEGVCLDGAALTAATLSAEVERLREALLARCPRHCEADHEAGVCELTRREVAALAGSPVERKPMFGGFAGVETGALVVPSDERRALAEWVREACITALAESDGDPRSLRDLDLDAMLEEP